MGKVRSKKLIDQPEYPQWKALVWRFARAGLAGGISAVVILHPDVSNLKVLLHTLGVAFGAGFISALGLALRNYFSDGDKGSMVQKLPL